MAMVTVKLVLVKPNIFAVLFSEIHMLLFFYEQLGEMYFRNLDPCAAISGKIEIIK